MVNIRGLAQILGFVGSHLVPFKVFFSVKPSEANHLFSGIQSKIELNGISSIHVWTCQ